MSEAADHRIRIARRIIAVLVVIGLVALAIIYVPRIASGNYHRATIERLASDALGREVRIAGPIELSLLPDPQLRADTITIGSPEGGLITAATLKLDLAPWPLLLGRLRATRLTLRKPDVSLPWPLPGGAAAVAPPLWLASLHATIVDGVFHLGALTIDHADLSIFTGGPNAVLAASGTLAIDGVPASVTLDIDDTGGSAPAPMRSAISLADHSGRIGFKGTLDHASVLRGALDGTLAATATRGAVRFHAELQANGAMVALRDIEARITDPKVGDATHTTGSAVIALAPAPLLRLDLTGARWRIGAGRSLLYRLASVLPFAARLDLTDSRFGSIEVPAVQAVVTGDAEGLALRSAALDLPGAATATLGETTPAGVDQFTVTAPDPATTIAALRDRYPWLPIWPDGIGALDLVGRLTIGADGAVRLAALHGAIGGGRLPRSTFEGALRVQPHAHHAAIAATIGFDHLTLDPDALASLRTALMRQTGSIAGPVALRARQLVIQPASGHKPVKPLAMFTHVLIDGALRDAAAGGGVAIALGTARLGRALLVGHGARQSDGGIIAARWVVTGPDAATSLTTMLHALGIDAGTWAGLALWHHPFAASLVAAGPMHAVHAGITLHLGTIRAAALPVIDLASGTATGAVSLHAPNAVALIRDVGGAGVLGARNGLDWPGAGSVSLRASAFAGAERIGLPGFVLSLGALTTSGALSLRAGTHPLLTGSLAADTLMLPQTAALLHLAGAALGSAVTITLPVITADRIVQAETDVTRHATGSLTVRAGTLSLGVAHADLAGGVLGGRFDLTGGATPGMSLKAHLQNADAAIVAHETGLAAPVIAGSLDLAADLTAQGATMAAWQASLTGSVMALGSGLDLEGIDLAAAGAALEQAVAAQPKHGTDAALRDALHGGTTRFDTATAAASLHGGVITLDQADLTGAAGRIALTGTLDLAQRKMALTATAQPALTDLAPPDLTIDITGSPAQPKVSTHLAPALGWVAAHRAPEPPAASPVSSP
jgi:uncharacterized protein involved in outer membrane biogenesis